MDSLSLFRNVSYPFLREKAGEFNALDFYILFFPGEGSRTTKTFNLECGGEISFSIRASVVLPF